MQNYQPFIFVSKTKTFIIPSCYKRKMTVEQRNPYRYGSWRGTEREREKNYAKHMREKPLLYQLIKDHFKLNVQLLEKGYYRNKQRITYYTRLQPRPKIWSTTVSV